MGEQMNFKFLSGAVMPMVGFGTWNVTGASVTPTIDLALAAGYRLFDTATMYGNESELGEAFKVLLPKHNLERKDIFITTKLYPDDHGEKATKAIKKSLKNLDCEYIDLYLIHWPGVYGVSPKSPENARLRDISWQKMVEAVKKGLVKNIGVSNYNVKHLKQLLQNDHGVKPVVNQVERHPHCRQKEILELCNQDEICLQAYMPLGGGGNKDLLENAKVKKIANKLGKTTAQVLLRWNLQQNVSVIPKSCSKEHIFSNFDLNFILPEEDMEVLNTFPQTKYDWDPDTIA
ncbi:unnamed protein product [Callosobruchus maculatus]|uniref:NADP-dependent oxidoreductase domain-containing protein n=3 Tax=Callosobruchus maculatus TaxID=64391 RepID=A0A653DII5_CALMS|nr:unnamed protein product [Callosobruchus maculatus]